jgi:hypothetical protein
MFYVCKTDLPAANFVEPQKLTRLISSMQTLQILFPSGFCRQAGSSAPDDFS